jgi:hypothetical protein
VPNYIMSQKLDTSKYFVLKSIAIDERSYPSMTVTRLCSDTVVFLIFSLFLSAPFVAIWGWIRWAKRWKQGHVIDLSFVGFVLALACLLFFLLMFGDLMGFSPRFRPHGPTIATIGAALSGFGLLYALCGAWRSGPLRWHAIVLGLGVFPFWFFGWAIAMVGPGF